MALPARIGGCVSAAPHNCRQCGQRRPAETAARQPRAGGVCGQVQRTPRREPVQQRSCGSRREQSMPMHALTLLPPASRPRCVCSSGVRTWFHLPPCGEQHRHRARLREATYRRKSETFFGGIWRASARSRRRCVSVRHHDGDACARHAGHAVRKGHESIARRPAARHAHTQRSVLAPARADTRAAHTQAASPVCALGAASRTRGRQARPSSASARWS